MAFTIGKNLNLNSSVSRGISQFEFGSSMLGRSANTRNPVNIVDNLNAIGVKVPSGVKKAAGMVNDLTSAYDSINRFLGKYSPQGNSALSVQDPELRKGKPTVFVDKDGNVVVARTGAGQNSLPQIQHVDDGIGLKQFLDYFSRHGAAVTNNFQVHFNNDTLTNVGPGGGNDVPQCNMLDIGMQLQSIEVPSQETGTTEISFDGRKIEIPTVHDYGHTFSMTVMNDANGLAYSTLMNYVRATQRDTRVLSPLNATIYSSSGSPSLSSVYPTYVGNFYNGQTVCLYGVRILGLGGLTFAHNNADIQTFTIDCYVQYITYGIPQNQYSGDVTDGEYYSVAGTDAIEDGVVSNWIKQNVLGIKQFGFTLSGDPNVFEDSSAKNRYLRSDNRWMEFK